MYRVSTEYKLQCQIDELMVQLTKKTSELDRLEEENKILRKDNSNWETFAKLLSVTSQKNDEKNAELKRTITTLESDNRALRHRSRKVKEVEKKLSEANSQCKKLQSDYDKAKEAYEYYQGKCGTMKVHLDYLREKLVFAQEESVRFRTLLNEVVEKVTGFATKVSVADTELVSKLGDNNQEDHDARTFLNSVIYQAEKWMSWISDTLELSQFESLNQCDHL
ncbi:hypothetical protein GCK72_025941 [Caenorhabditis remanei]|uniref:Uncharacterized protein n=1 Tax=Caenorhabditis remanei TaxID=31234 RepID=A0A6A5G3T4_CAERE|nr:hypothetical protein GCK72_025941 [Caenorhabditis remanei]KAF1749473.1 hypothetical protein GCK72_025941 [Caenorhabditis remanei]